MSDRTVFGNYRVTKSVRGGGLLEFGEFCNSKGIAKPLPYGWLYFIADHIRTVIVGAEKAEANPKIHSRF